VLTFLWFADVTVLLWLHVTVVSQALNLETWNNTLGGRTKWRCTMTFPNWAFIRSTDHIFLTYASSAAVRVGSLPSGIKFLRLQNWHSRMLIELLTLIGTLQEVQYSSISRRSGYYIILYYIILYYIIYIPYYYNFLFYCSPAGLMLGHLEAENIQGVPGGRDKTSGECSLC